MDVFLATMLAFSSQYHVPAERVELLGPIIWEESAAVGEDPYLVAAVSWVEGRWTHGKVSRTGDCGPMQVNPRWNKHTCKQLLDPRTGVRAGVGALQAWRKWVKRKRKRRNKLWVCHYNSGYKCVPRSRSYARAVLRTKKRLMKMSATQLSLMGP